VTDEFRLTGHPDSAGTGGRSGAASTRSSSMLGDAIMASARKRWTEEEPAEGCFDHDPARMGTFINFLEGGLPPDAMEEARGHLLDCPRCCFLYATLYGTSQRGADPVPEVLRTHLRSRGPVVFPGGEVAEGAWEFGLLGELPSDTVEQITEAVADRAWRRLRGVLPHKQILIVCFSYPVHCFGKRLAAKMLACGVGDVHVVMADDFFNPKLWCHPRELKDKHVVVVVDVVRSGGLVMRLCAVCRQAGPSDVTAVAVIDQSRGLVSEEPLRSLWIEPPDQRAPRDGGPPPSARFFDPVAGRAFKDLPREVADPDRARATIESHLREMGPLLRYIEETGALKQDTWIGGVCYPWAVDILRLLRHDAARAELLRRAAARLSDLAASGPWCLVYPAERFRRAGAWANLLAEKFGWPVVRVGRKNCTHYRQLTLAQHRALDKCPRAVVIDAAIRTGKTLQSLVGVLRASLQSTTGALVAFYALDGLCQRPRDALQSGLGVEVRSLFQLPLGAPTDPVGRHWRHRLAETLTELDGLDRSGCAAWVDVVRRYCQKKLTRPRHPTRRPTSDGIEFSLRRALDEGERGVEARLEHSCNHPRPTFVRHLDIAYTLREPRTRNVLHGFLCNSMPSEFIESCALALATQRQFDWLDRDWLSLHRRLFTEPESERWQFLACVSYWIRRQGNPQLIARVLRAVDEFRRSHVSHTPSLFAHLPGESEPPGSLEARCQTLISVLSEA
jgi:adenine/guanine phosphoribosyltransferase-like PRPP-binding protein